MIDRIIPIGIGIAALFLALLFTVFLAPVDGHELREEDMALETRDILINQPKGVPLTAEQLRRIQDAQREFDSGGSLRLFALDVLKCWWIYIVVPLVACGICRRKMRNVSSSIFFIMGPSLLFLIFVWIECG